MPRLQFTPLVLAAVLAVLDTATANRFASASQLAKVDYLSVTQPVDLDSRPHESVVGGPRAGTECSLLGFTACGTGSRQARTS